jgi:hypothetical protein
MAGRCTGSYLDQSDGWRAVAILADVGQASLVERIPGGIIGIASTDGNPGLRSQAGWPVANI